MINKLRKLTHTFMFRISFWFILCNVAIYFILGYSLIRVSSEIFVKRAEDYTEKTLEQASINLNSNLSYVRSSLVLLATNDDVIHSMDHILSLHEQLNYDQSIHQIMLNLNLFQPFIQDILVIGNNGYVNNIVSRRDLYWDYDFLNALWYQEAIDYSQGTSIKTLGLHYQDFYFQTYLSEKPTISMSMMVFNSRKEIIGAVVCNFNLEKLSEQLVRTTYEKNGRMALLDADGTILIQSDGKRSGEFIGFSPENLAQISETSRGAFYSDINDISHIIVYHDTEFKDWKLLSYIPVEEITSDVSLLVRMIFIILCICFLINLLISTGLTRHFGASLKKLLNALQVVNVSQPEMPAAVYSYTELNTISDSFNMLMKRLDALIDTNYRIKLLQQKAELQALQYQINPHFLFNTLQLLQTEILYNDVDTSNKIIISLSKILQYTTCNYDEMVTLEQELEYVRNYLLLFQKKEEDFLQVEYQIDPETLDLKVPKLILQPIVENCVKYAFPLPAPSDFIKIQFMRISGKINLIIEDNGKGIEPHTLQALQNNLKNQSSEAYGIGLENVLKRLRIAYSSQSSLTVESSPGKGTRVTLSIIEEKNL